MVGEKSVDIRLRTALPRRDPGSCQELQRLLPGQSKLQRNSDESSHRRGQVECFHQPFQIRPTILWSEGARRVHFFNVLLATTLRRSHLPGRNSTGMVTTKVLDKQSQLMNSPCGDPNKELNHKEENQK